MPPQLIDAIVSLLPGARVVVRGEAVEYLDYDAPPLDDAAIAAELERLRTRHQILSEIQMLEAQQTPRRMREAALGTDGGWLATLDQEINALRDRLAVL